MNSKSLLTSVADHEPIAVYVWPGFGRGHTLLVNNELTTLPSLKSKP